MRGGGEQSRVTEVPNKNHFLGFNSLHKKGWRKKEVNVIYMFGAGAHKE